MGRRFDKKNATTFNVVHRAHDDARFYDDDATAHVLVPKEKKKPKGKTTDNRQPKIYSTSDLEKKLKPEDIKTIRDNEGLAAQYGVFFDDSKYDYMQHLKPIGGAKDAVFIEATKKEPKEKKLDFNEIFQDQLPSTEKRKVAADAYESIPAELRGFQPDMDPRIREVLEALEDEAYITDDEVEAQEEGDIFAELLKSGEADEEDFYDEDYDEWDLDNYQDEFERYDLDGRHTDDEEYYLKDQAGVLNEEVEIPYETPEIPYNEGEAPEPLADDVRINTNWQEDFMRFKKETKDAPNEWDSEDEFEEEDDLGELPQIGGKKSKSKMRKKKGAMTDVSSFSMTSSANFRSEGLTLLDDRYEQLARKFEAEDEDKYEEFDMTKERTDFEGMLDDFLDNFELEGGGRRLVKKDEERQKIQDAADAVSKSKLAAKRRREKNKPDFGMGSLRI